MRLFALAFLASALLTAVSAIAQEPLTGGSPSDKKLTPGWARFEPTPANIFWTARAQEDMAHRQAIQRHYQWIGYDPAHPVINPTSMNLAYPVIPRRRWFGSYAMYNDPYGIGY